MSAAVGDCSIMPDAKDFLSLAFGYANVLKRLNDAIPSAEFVVNWFGEEASITDCKFVFRKDGQTRMVNCFTMQAYLAPGGDKLAPKLYVCEEVSQKVQLLEDVDYYPYVETDEPEDGSPVPGVDVFWVTKGGGTLSLGVEDKLRGGRITTTEGGGVAEVKWKVSDKAGRQDLTAQVFNADFTVLEKEDFSTMTIMPLPKVVAVGDKQTGSSGQTLAAPIVISVVDQLDNIPMLAERFDLQWEVIKGGGTLLPDPRAGDISQLISFGRAWKLGPEVGEQQVKVTIVNKNCSPWVIEGNPYYFTATAGCPEDPVQFALLTGGNTKVWTHVATNGEAAEPTCGKNDTYTFSVNHVLTRTNWNEDCTSSGGRTTFKLCDNKIGYLADSGPAFVYPFTIVTLTATQLVFRTRESDGKDYVWSYVAK